MKRLTPTALVLLILVGTAQAIDIPNMKEGLWKLHFTTSSSGSKPDDSTYFLCRNHAYDQSGKALADKFLKSCSTLSDKTSLGKRYLDMTCKVAGSTLTSKAVITSTGDTFFRTETTTTYSPALAGESQSKTVQEETYVGSCPAGMGPGDRKMSDGSIQHHH